MLSSQEINILSLLAQGYNNTQIAEKILFKEESVRHYLTNIRRKLGYPKYTRKDVSSMRVQLAVYAIQAGLVTLQSEQVKLPNRTYVVTMQHKYAINDIVRVINKDHKSHKQYGIIRSLMPYTVQYPSYNVEIDGRTLALSERSLEKAK